MPGMYGLPGTRHPATPLVSILEGTVVLNDYVISNVIREIYDI